MGAGPDPYAAGGTDSRPRLPEPTTPGGSRSRQGGLYRQGWGVAGREGAVDTAAEPLPGAEAGKELREAAGAGGGAGTEHPLTAGPWTTSSISACRPRRAGLSPTVHSTTGRSCLCVDKNRNPKHLCAPALWRRARAAEGTTLGRTEAPVPGGRSSALPLPEPKEVAPAPLRGSSSSGIQAPDAPREDCSQHQNLQQPLPAARGWVPTGRPVPPPGGPVPRGGRGQLPYLSMSPPSLSLK